MSQLCACHQRALKGTCSTFKPVRNSWAPKQLKQLKQLKPMWFYRIPKEVPPPRDQILSSTAVARYLSHGLACQ